MKKCNQAKTTPISASSLIESGVGGPCRNFQNPSKSIKPPLQRKSTYTRIRPTRESVIVHVAAPIATRDALRRYVQAPGTSDPRVEKKTSVSSDGSSWWGADFYECFDARRALELEGKIIRE